MGLPDLMVLRFERDYRLKEYRETYDSYHPLSDRARAVEESAIAYSEACAIVESSISKRR